MNPARALAINAALVETWMIREGLREGPLPSFAGISLQDAVTASEMMGTGMGRMRNADGSTTFVCRVEPSRVPELCAWALCQMPATGNPNG